MNDTTLYDEILGLKTPWYVAAVRLEVAKLEVEIEVRFKETAWACPECQRRMHIHEYTERRWRHLDSCQFKTIIVCQVPRVQCSEHGSQTVRVPWAEKQGRFTMLFERFAIAVLQECSISAACKLLQISWDEADGIKQRAVKRGLERKVEKVHARIGIDEKSYKKGHNYVTLVASLQEEETIVEYVGDGKSKESLDDYWNKFEKEELQDIEAISMDMSTAYRQSAIDNVPEAEKKLVFDRFHIIQHINKSLNTVLSYFKHRLTNAALEGINNKIQALIKKAYGYRNKDRFKDDILFHCGGLNLYPEMGK